MKLVKKRYLFAVMVFLSLGFTTENEERNIYSVPMDYLVEVPQLATVEPAQKHNSHQSTISFSSFDEKKTFVDFKESLAHRESRGSYSVVNRFGYMGKYQFGKRLLRFFGVTDTDAFLQSPQLQEQVFSLSLQRSKWFLRKEIAQNVGKKINGIEITESVILAAAHLAGATSVKNFLKTKAITTSPMVMVLPYKII